MVKVKNKNNIGISDKLHSKKTKAKFKKQLNPFEVHINKEKFKVLGKRSKNDRGLPGVSRAKAMKKRKNTLGYELKLMNKSNTFLDKRIGEKNTKISEEDKIIARFAAEKIHQHKAKTGKTSKYNLAEDEILTHRGQTLEEIEKFDDPRSDDDDDDEDFRKRPGHLQNNFVSDANFGGGVLSRSENMDGAMSRKDLIEQLIIESKKRKLEKQKLKEETLDLTEKLDTEWKDLHSVVSKDFNKEIEDKKQEKPSLIDKLLSEHNKKNEEYDKTMRELKFEPRGTPSDRLKSEDEIAKIEKEKLEKLEKDRIIRMRGTIDTDVSSKSKYRSADDLDDDFQSVYEPEFMIAYNKEGKLLKPLNNQKNDDDNEEDNSSGDENDEIEQSDDDNNEENKSDDESDSDSVDSLSDLRQAYVSTDEDQDEPEMEISPQKTKNKSDKLSIDDSKDKVKQKQVKDTKKEKSKIQNEDLSNQNETIADENIKKDLLMRKEIMDKAHEELPFTFEMPKDYEELAELLDKHSVNLRPIIVDRIIKCNHPSLNEGNKEKLGNLLAYLLQYVNDLFSEDSISNKDELIDAFKCFNTLVSHLHTISQMDPINAKNCVIEVIKEKYDDFKKNPMSIPSLDTLMFFQLVFFLFPTSDQKHPVVTPCILFMSHILAKCNIKNSIDISKGLFIVGLLSSYVSLSKRFVPEAVNFIRGILALFVPHNIRTSETFSDLPFKFIHKSQNVFVLSESSTEANMMQKSLPIDFLIVEKSKDELNSILSVTLRMYEKYFEELKNYHCQGIIFEKHFKIINSLIAMTKNEQITKILNNTKSKTELTEKKLLRLVEKNKLPNTFKTFEPSFDTEFSGKKRRVMSKEKADYQKLLYKHKKEMKGALREIRRDKAFIGDVKIKEKLKSDEIRKQKVKRIFSEATSQQGELNALQRSKKKKK